MLIVQINKKDIPHQTIMSSTHKLINRTIEGFIIIIIPQKLL